MAPQRFALLIGVDEYETRVQPNIPEKTELRKNEEGRAISITNLRGCVNDVNKMENLLNDEFEGVEVKRLTSSATDESPTYNKIIEELDKVRDKANDGDFFLFHFSGHGAQLLTTRDPASHNSQSDVSLIPCDYPRGGRPLRGWELNEKLKEIHDKNVTVVVTLDSCYSGKALRRNDIGYRFAGDLTQFPNLPNDKEEFVKIADPSPGRNARAEYSWDLNPEHLTLMLACEGSQCATEKRHQSPRDSTEDSDKRWGGIFTHALVTSLKIEGNRKYMSYSDLVTIISQELENDKQEPQVFGQSTRAFYEVLTPEALGRLIVKIEDIKGQNESTVIFPVGSIHGILKGTEFRIYQSKQDTDPEASQANHIQLVVSDVEATISRGKIQNIHVDSLKAAQNMVILSKIALEADKSFDVHIQGQFMDGFETDLQRELQNKITAPVIISALEDVSILDSTTWGLKQTKDGGVEILGKNGLVGYDGPVRDLIITASESSDLARKCAVYLLHLARFSQVLELSNQQCKAEKPFTVTLNPSCQESPSFPEGDCFRLTIENTGNETVSVMVIALGPGFSLNQIFPKAGQVKEIQQGKSAVIQFRTAIPIQLKGKPSEKRTYRDIIRVIAMRGSKTSWTSQSLPEIWDAHQVVRKKNEMSNEEDNRNMDDIRELDICEWWTEDNQLLTHEALNDSYMTG